ncbi:MAG: hypothetical protein GY823_13760 [Flavobacteriaceae bacterium]|nr:hypothetical protein [Flavobacteriaceae bacterium]
MMHFEVLGDKIGEGSYGKVYKVRNKKTRKIYAMKEIKMMNRNEGIPPTTLREMSFL